MGDSSDVVISDVKFAASDGTVLVGDVVVPGDCRAGAIVCHPHPQFGGDRHNHVVTALFEALPRPASPPSVSISAATSAKGSPKSTMREPLSTRSSARFPAF